MNAIIMAGGEGTRLKPVTGDIPKPMALLAGKPVLEHVLLLLKGCGINNVCITLRYRPEVIIDYFGSGRSLDMKITYHIESEPLGTAGGVKACSEFYDGRDFMVISGDCACDFDLRQLMEAHRRHSPAVTMALFPYDSPLQYGTVLTDELGRVVSFTEKPEWSRVVSDLVNTGIYIVSPDAMSLVPENTAFDFAKDLFPRLMMTGLEIRGVPLSGYWCDIGTPRAYHQCNLDALDGRLKIALPETDGLSVPRLSRQARSFRGATRETECKNRARIMRALSQSLMEAGADFSDGITLKCNSGTVHIAPSEGKNAIVINAEAKNSSKSDELATEYETMVKRFVRDSADG